MSFDRTASCGAVFLIWLCTSVTSATAQAQFPANCNNGRFFTTSANTISGGSSNTGGITVAAAEASTVQALEMVAQRRIQEAQACPVGSVREGGICIRKKETPRRVTSTRTSGPRPSAPTPDTEPSPEVSVQPPANALWAEGFADYEKRTGLGNATASQSRSQKTSGVLFGADHTLQAGEGSVTVGFLGGVNQTRQEFKTISQQVLDTPYFATLKDFNTGNSTTFEYLLPANHEFASDATQTLRGGSFGTTYSASRGGLFTDGIFKIDFYEIEKVSSGSDTYPTTLNAFFGNAQSGQFGCISPFVNANNGGTLSQYPAPGYLLNGTQTFAIPTTVQTTTAANFILAQDLGYHFALAEGFWIEPLVGARYTYSAYGPGGASLGLQDGYDLRVEAGSRFGRTTFAPSGYLLTASFTALLYSDVLVHGFVTNADGFSAGFLLADQGKLRGQGIASLKLDLLNGFSFFAECQGRGGQDYWGVGGRIGGRYQF